MSEVRIGATIFCALLALASVATPALPDVIARGDAAYLRRAEGGRDGRAAPEPIGEAIRAYQEAVAIDPRDLEARWKLLRALHFEGDFATEVEDLAIREEARARLEEERASVVGRQ